MARDLNRLFQDLQNSREVYVTQDGRVERVDEANENAAQEEAQDGAPRPRTQLKPEIFGSDTPLLVADTFFQHVHESAARYDGETGGIGMGPDPFTLTEFIPSGPRANRSSGSFQLDPEYLQPLLERAERRGLVFNTVWHSHPEGCPRPSGTDRDAARSMLTSPDWGLDGHVFLPISVRRGTQFETRFFVAKGREARIADVTPVLVSASRIQSLESNATARLESDMRLLEKDGWSASLRESGNGRALRIERAQVVLWFRLPDEYPVSAPEVLFEEGATLRNVPVRETPELFAWSSLRSIAVVAEQAWKAILDTREAESLIVRPRLIRTVHRLFAARVATAAPGLFLT